jgi:leader peptidase (prepilin peptidase) / N-methyltransferase
VIFADLPLWVTAVLSVLLLLVVWIDVRRMIIPDWLNASLALSGACVGVWFFNTAVLSVLAQTLLIYSLFWLGERLYFSLRKVAGLGGGDVKLLAAASCWVGLLGLPWVVLIAAVSGLTFVLISHLIGRGIEAGQRLAFGPHVSLGLFVTWMFRDVLFNFTA